MRMMWYAFSILRKKHSLFCTDLRELSFHSVCYAHSNLLHLWCRNDVSLPVKGRVYNAAVCSDLLYGCETWPLRQQVVHHLELFDHYCLRPLARVGWSDRVSNLEVRTYVLGGNGSDALFRRIKLCRLRWLGHVLRMEPHRLPHRALFSMPQTG